MVGRGSFLHASTPERRKLHAGKRCGIVSLVGKAEQADFWKLAFPGGGASEPHRSKYIAVVGCFM